MIIITHYRTRSTFRTIHECDVSKHRSDVRITYYLPGMDLLSKNILYQVTLVINIILKLYQYNNNN